MPGRIGPELVARYLATHRSSSSVSFRPGMTRVVTSSQMPRSTSSFRLSSTGFKARAGDLAVELAATGLQVHVDAVIRPVHQVDQLGRHVTVADKDVLQPQRLASRRASSAYSAKMVGSV